MLTELSTFFSPFFVLFTTIIFSVFEYTLQKAWAPVAGSVAPTLTEWFSRYGERRYGRSVAAATAAWKSLGSGLYAGKGGGFGSAISSLPVQCGPGQAPGPPPPKGYVRRHPADGYWAPPPPNSGPLSETSLDTCADYCDKDAACLAFEVYIVKAPSTGNCYLYHNITGPFVVMGPARTYLKVKNNSASLPEPQQLQPVAPFAGEKSLADASGNNNNSNYYYHAQMVPYSQQPYMVRVAAASAANIETRQQVADNGVDVAWRTLLEAAPQLRDVESYRFDVVDLGRQVIASNYSSALAEFRARVTAGDVKGAAKVRKNLDRIIADYDMLLSSDVNFLLGRWIQWARDSAPPNNSSAAADALEFNARNQITLWGPTGQINDYAKKEWGGLVKAYYGYRQSLYFNMTMEALAQNTSLDQGDYCYKLLEFEMAWQHDTTPFPVTPQGDAIDIAVALAKAYVP